VGYLGKEGVPPEDQGVEHSQAYLSKQAKSCVRQPSQCVMNQLDPIEELYDMYSEEEDTPRIVEIEDDGLGLDSDIEGLANPYMDL